MELTYGVYIYADVLGIFLILIMILIKLTPCNDGRSHNKMFGMSEYFNEKLVHMMCFGSHPHDTGQGQKM